MDYLEPNLYREFAKRELSSVIEPAISQAGGKVLAAVHVGSTVNNPPTLRVWPLALWKRYPQLGLENGFWGLCGPPDVDLAIIYEGTAPTENLWRYYDSLRGKFTNVSLRGELKPEHVRPVLDVEFYSRQSIESLIAKLADSKEDVVQLARDVKEEHETKGDVDLTTRIKFVKVMHHRMIGASDGDKMLAGLITSDPSQRYNLVGHGYAEEISSRLAETYWSSEIHSMIGEHQSAKQYINWILTRATEEGGNLAMGAILRLNAAFRETMLFYGHLKGGSEVRDPYGDLCLYFLPNSEEINHIFFVAQVAGYGDLDVLDLITKNKIPKIHTTPKNVDKVTKSSKVFHTPEEFAQVTQNLR